MFSGAECKVKFHAVDQRGADLDAGAVGGLDFIAERLDFLREKRGNMGCTGDAGGSFLGWVDGHGRLSKEEKNARRGWLAIGLWLVAIGFGNGLGDGILNLWGRFGYACVGCVCMIDLRV